MVLPNVTVLISFFLTEGNTKILIHKEKSRFPFSATAHRVFELFKKAVLDFFGVQSLAEAKGLGRSMDCSFMRTVRSGTVESKTIRSVNMINQGMARLQSNIAKINPELTANPEALLTIKVENLHAVSHFKHSTCMQLHYARESAKRMTQWSAFYFPHSTSYYPVPSTQIHLQDFPRMTQQNLPVMS